MINLRRRALAGTELAKACTATIRVQLLKIAAAVVEECYREKFAQLPKPADVEADVRTRMFNPDYSEYL